MTTYNFTIRASDSAGAFADQNFSIDVQRTRIDRFVVTCANGILRSPDAKTWTAEAAPAMSQVSYANGRWIGVASGSTPSICTSTDAVNWITADIVLPKVSGQTAQAHYLGVVKYRNGKWMALGWVNNTNIVAEWSSADLITWTLVTSFPVTAAGTVVALPDFEFDQATQTTVVFVTTNVAGLTGAYTRVGAANAYTQTFPAPITSLSDVTVQFRNGLWTVHSYQFSPIFISRDGVNWVSRNPGVGTSYAGIHGLTYSNGKLIAATINNSTGVCALFSSSDGGITWVSKGDLNISAPSSRQITAAYGGTLVVLSGSQNIYTSPNDGATGTTTAVAAFPPLSTPRGIYTRQA